MKPKLSVYLSDQVAKRLTLAANRPGTNKSAIVDAALDRFLNPERDQSGDAALVRRLDRMSRQLGQIDRDLSITAETIALFVRYYLTITPPLPSGDQNAARALGRERFDMFVAQVGKRVASGGRLVADVMERVSASNPDLFFRNLKRARRWASQRQTMKLIPVQWTQRASRRSILRKDERRSAMSDLLSPETRERRRNMLRTAMGPAIALALDEPDVVEVLVNPDGRLWLDRHGSGRADTGVVLTPHEAERIIRLVASHVRAEASGSSPVVSAELPETGERFEGLLPPVTLAACFAIRKPAMTTFRLADYVKAQIASPVMAKILTAAVAEGRNILVAGGTGSGKTTLANALLAEVAGLDQRVVIIEDTRELRCDAKDAVALRTKPGVATLADLVRSTLRLRPDRIVVGEVRGGEALDMLKAWNTGHPGGIATVHANSARAALYRIEQLIQEAVTTVPRRLIAEAIDLVVFIKGRGPGRRIETAVEVKGLDLSGSTSSKFRPACRTQSIILDRKLENPMMFGLRKSTRVRLGRVRDVAGPVMAEFGASAIVTLLTVSTAHAAGSGMPWEAPLERILESVQGPVAKIVAVMIITVTESRSPLATLRAASERWSRSCSAYPSPLPQARFFYRSFPSAAER